MPCGDLVAVAIEERKPRRRDTGSTHRIHGTNGIFTYIYIYLGLRKYKKNCTWAKLIGFRKNARLEKECSFWKIDLSRSVNGWSAPYPFSHPFHFPCHKHAFLTNVLAKNYPWLAGVLSKRLCPLILVVDQTFSNGLYPHLNPMNPTAHPAYSANIIFIGPAHCALYGTNRKRGQDFGLNS